MHVLFKLIRIEIIAITILIVGAGSVRAQGKVPAERKTVIVRKLSPAWRLVARAQIAFNQHQYLKTIDLCKEAIRKDPRYARAYSWLGTACARRYLALAKSDNAAYRQKAAQQRQAAIDAFRKVLSLAPGSVDAGRARAGLKKLGAVSTIAKPPSAPQSPVTPQPITSAHPESQIYINGRLLQVSSPPVFSMGRMLVPMRDIFEALGASVSYNSEHVIVAQRGDTRIWLRIGSEVAGINGATNWLDQAPIVVNGTAMVPVRFVSEALGAKVDWDAAERRLNITSDVSSDAPIKVSELKVLLTSTSS
jgi:tetratricopeptide (TPR) repeat protein